MQCPKCLRCPTCRPKSICNIDHCTGCRRGGGGRGPGAGQARLGPGRPLQDRPQRGGQPRQPAGRRGHGRAAGQSSHDSFFVYLPVFHTVTVRCVVSLAFSTETLEFTRNNQPSAVLRAAAKSGNYGLQARHLNILFFLLVAIADHHQLDVSHK